MAQIIARSLAEHRERSMSVLVIFLVFALVILTIMGTGTTAFASLLGIVLCVICLFRREARIDWWIFIPLALYLLMNFLSAWKAYGDPLFGYGPTQLIYLSLYAAVCSLRSNEMRSLRALCVLWAGVTAVIGIGGFIFQTFDATATRLEFVVGTPNGLGIFLVLSWFALQSCRLEQQKGMLFKVIDRLEPVILVALALTLSMGSFAALLVGFIVLFISRARATSFGETLKYAASLLARIVLSLGVGLLMYMAAERANAPILCLVIAAYVVAMVCLWKRFTVFLEEKRKCAFGLSIVGLLCIPFALFMRPNALATFNERFAMMQNGLEYLGKDPVFGTGPFTWRFLNIQDSGLYYNTNHIHNMFIHAGVEFGLIAMIALIVIAVRFFIKRYKEAQHGEGAAFLFHMLTDTGFFYLGVVGAFILTAGGANSQEVTSRSIATRAIFGILALLHFAILWMYIASF